MADVLARNKLIDDVTNIVKKQLAQNQHALLQSFIEQYLNLLSYEDLREQTIMDLAGIILSHWHFLQGRENGKSKVRVFNPSYEEYGWQSAHTVIEIAHDDMPFLVDSIRMEINRHGLGVHLIIHVGGMKVRRDEQNNIIEVLPWGAQEKNYATEAPIHIEIDKTTDETFLQELRQNIIRILADVQVTVNDWQAMQARVKDAIRNLEENPPMLDAADIAESKHFLHWLGSNNFTFLGCRDYDLVGEENDKALKMVANSGLGVLRDDTTSLKYRNFSNMTPEALSLMLSPQVLIIAKTNTQSSVHRSVYSDYIGVKRFDTNGKLIGERRFIGLFTSAAYSSSVQSIPYVRLKVSKIMSHPRLPKQSHALKALLNILETFPRDDLFQASVEELQDIAMGVFNIHERNRVRLFLRKDIYGRYVSCFVFIPKKRFNNELRKTIQEILEWNLAGKKAQYDTYFGESVLARIHYIIRIHPQDKVKYNAQKIEQEIISISNSWRDHLYKILLDYYGEEKGIELFECYVNAFPAGYREYSQANVAVSDVKYLQQISMTEPLKLNLYTTESMAANQLNFKIYRKQKTAPLSDVMPILENMGLRVVGEHTFEIKPYDKGSIWINDFNMEYIKETVINLNIIKNKLQQAFAKVWYNEFENDGFNKLILLAELDWREILVLRSLTKYLRQINITYSQNYIEDTFNRHPNIARMLIKLFNMRFDPQNATAAIVDIASMEERLNRELDAVSSLDDDRILRLYLILIKAMTRTNYFQMKDGQFKSYLSFKFIPKLIPQLPNPKPEYEIFVYSSNFEGIHLRCGKIARGGIRWSDRREDFRTEILGLMKAQQVKNAVIVPAGAKGGFVVKNINKKDSREVSLKEVKICYQNFIRGLLDITDNYVNNEIKFPDNMVRYDTEDPYLVVAADKGTATFSDIANEISAEYDFWLSDAFASGGNTGYDHKKMGITARGAWISVARHFKNRNINIHEEDFTVIGIGDMSGDVFGNGMLLSKHIKLVAAFNHQHIFLDPTPDVETSYAERKRLFDLPRSSWNDYNKDLLSKGGGIFCRAEKSIKLSRAVRKLLNTTQEQMIPAELIKVILCAKVDLLWNGGIGTYVKSSQELNNEVGDRTNDAVRISANELQCMVVGEGGNLGFTQSGRVEYALNNGAIYTDFIDNSAGVDCSDKEVNIKILLNDILHQNVLSLSQRNRLLREMTDDIAELVLYDNYRQTQAIELANSQATKQVDLHGRFVSLLEEKNIIDRDLEALPSVEVLLERKANGKGLTTPEISVLISYSKILLQTRLIESDVPEDPWLARYFHTAFPDRLVQRFSKQLAKHRLRREIITTQLSNDLINEVGAVFIYRMYHETGATYTDIVRAYMAARECFDMKTLWNEIQLLDYKIPAATQIKMMLLISKLVRRFSRWLIRQYRCNLDIMALIDRYKNDTQKLIAMLPKIMLDERKDYFVTLRDKLEAEGVPNKLATKVATCDAMFPALEIIDAAHRVKVNLRMLAKIYFELGRQLNLSWLRYEIRKQKNETYWEGLALASIFDDIDNIQSRLALDVIHHDDKIASIPKQIEKWCERHQRLTGRWLKMINNMRSSNIISPVMLFVGLRELTDLAQTCHLEHQK